MAQQTFTCEACSASFISSEQLDAHTSEVHTDELFVCPTCLEKFDTDNELALHQQAQHRDVAPDTVPCPECGLVFGTAALLEDHLASSHPHFTGMTRGG